MVAQPADVQSVGPNTPVSVMVAGLLALVDAGETDDIDGFAGGADELLLPPPPPHPTRASVERITDKTKRDFMTYASP
jgi:hypothetical protein